MEANLVVARSERRRAKLQASVSLSAGGVEFTISAKSPLCSGLPFRFVGVFAERKILIDSFHGPLGTSSRLVGASGSGQTVTQSSLPILHDGKQWEWAPLFPGITHHNYILEMFMHYVGSSVLEYVWKEISSKGNLVFHVVTKLRHIYCFLGGGRLITPLIARIHSHQIFTSKDKEPEAWVLH